MRVWVGNLGKYNEGELVGEWITLPMPKNQLDDILRNKVGLQLTQQEVDEALRTTGECYEEYFIADSECPELPNFDAEKFGRDIGGDYVVVSNNYGHQSILDTTKDIDSEYYSKDELYELVEDDIKSQPVIDKSILQNDETFRYQLLGRMQTDCNYFLGNGNRLDKFLWAGNVESQIAYMKALYNSFPDDKKPEWISLEDINNYEDAMTNDEVNINNDKDEPDICD